jgi:hypothetical protein
MKKFYINTIKDLLRPAYYFSKDIIDFSGKKRLRKNIELKDLYIGEKAFLLLTGESLQQIDIKKLNNEYTFSTGFIFLHNDIKDINLTFYINGDSARCFNSDTDPDRIDTFYKDIDKRIERNTTLLLHSDNYNLIVNNNLFIDKKKYFIKVKKSFYLDKKIPYGNTADLTKRSLSGGGSVFFAILIMMYMGFKEIYLAGAGYTYEPMYCLHFYDNYVFPKNMGKEKTEIEARKVIKSRNRNLGSTLEYYGLFEKNEFYRVICVIRKTTSFNNYIKMHQMMNDYAKSQGVRIYNIVPAGFESRVYEKINWQKVKNKVLLKQN